MRKSIPAANPAAYVAGLDGWRRARVEELRAAVLDAAPLDEVGAFLRLETRLVDHS